MPWAKKIAGLIGLALLALVHPAVAQVAISQLPAATALGGTEVAPVVQSGTTVKATMAQIAAYLAGKTNTWSTTQTFTVAPVFTDQSGSRTALGLTIGTSGATIPLLNSNPTWGSSSALGSIFPNIGEVATVSATAATGTINYDVTTQSVLYYTTNASANWTLNLRGNGSTTLNTLMSTGQSVTVAFLVTQGVSPFYNNVVQVDGTTTGVTTKWQGGAPLTGNASGIDVYTYTILKTGSATYTVLATQSAFL